MLLLIAFLCFAMLIVACMLAPTSATKAPSRDEMPVEARQPVLA